LIVSLFAQTTFADVIDASGIRWPIPAWNIVGHQKERMQSAECQDFLNFTTRSKNF